MNLQNPKTMSEELRSQITLAAFVAYIMHKEGLDQPAALSKSAHLCTLTQIALFDQNWIS